MYNSKTFAGRIALLAAAALGVSVMVAVPAMGDPISVSTVASPKTSVASMNIGTGTTAINDDRITHPKHFDSGPGSQAATIVVSVKDGAGSAITSGTLTAFISGAGLLGTGTGPTTGYLPSSHEISVPLSDSIPGKYVFAVFGDGKSGYSEITVYQGTIVLARKFASFYGEVSSLTAIVNLASPNVDGSPLGSYSAHNPGDGTYVHTPSVILTAKDANGVPVANEEADEFSAISSDLTVVSSQIMVVPDDGTGAGSLGFGTYNVQIHGATGGVSGKSATLTFRYSHDGANFVLAKPVVFTTSSTTISGVNMSLDKTSYAPGETAILTITANDPSNMPVSGEDAGGFFASSVGLTTSSPITKLLFPFTTLTFIRGQVSTTFDVPSTTGLFTISGRLGNGPNLIPGVQGSPVSATATILTRQDLEMSALRSSVDAAQTSAKSAFEAASAAVASVNALSAIVKSMLAIILKMQKRLGIK